VLAWPALLRALVEQEPSDPWPPIRSTTTVRICDASADVRAPHGSVARWLVERGLKPLAPVGHERRRRCRAATTALRGGPRGRRLAVDWRASAAAAIDVTGRRRR
jgi:hypothetical protein